MWLVSTRGLVTAADDHPRSKKKKKKKKTKKNRRRGDLCFKYARRAKENREHLHAYPPPARKKNACVLLLCNDNV